ncbi:hypothetical protein WJ0W_004629 [Paenibacillus melissococcoides]|uniref:Uncharacterized protein n=1 Tax=Paenibacillus melissococcoides TaxID=2912268 RepID=A0ABM9G680_9BACL|nr:MULTISPECIES: hypothetical protein [Paenibacillus]MEB9895111.1 hypothetical protein [Bacillus cereus]CAH8247395.1 hypothetical protein WJ0W_004629 [Paenibacillus melissococcoides]CAH8705274.1 hypothetical protein WDD9_000920 [Paenibacillus melissococcoides]CAH8708495.1 hypothetical protein HTL2_002005 [Paenibacillus melissococcoides]GIO79424.1 hypothetical protein J6TS7_30340 [Paenibacillus dendritiformis]
MTNEELKEAMTSGEAVEHRGTTYSYISAIIYRKSEAGMFIQAELMDRHNNCVVIARPIEVKRLEDKEAK